MNLESQIIGCMQDYLKGNSGYQVRTAPVKLSDGIIEASLSGVESYFGSPNKFVTFRAIPKGKNAEGQKYAELRIENCTNSAGKPYSIVAERHTIIYED